MSNPNLLTTEPLHVDFNEVDSGMLPSNLVDQMATNVVRTLVRAGIDPNAVYFRGRAGQTAEDTGAARERMEEVHKWGSVDDFGTSDDDLIAERLAADDPYEDIFSDKKKARNRHRGCTRASARWSSDAALCIRTARRPV